MIQRYEYYNANIEPRLDGRIVFYADAEKWVGEEIAKKEEMISGPRENKLYLENDLALKMEEIAALKSLVDGAIEIVTAFPVSLPAQKDWLAKAREALK